MFSLVPCSLVPSSASERPFSGTCLRCCTAPALGNQTLLSRRSRKPDASLRPPVICPPLPIELEEPPARPPRRPRFDSSAPRSRRKSTNIHFSSCTNNVDKKQFSVRQPFFSCFLCDNGANETTSGWRLGRSIPLRHYPNLIIQCIKNRE